MQARSSKIFNFGKLLLGSSAGQIVALALYPYIARFYSPEDFSQFGLMVSLTVLLGVFATGQLHVAIMNPEDEEEAKQLVGLATVLVTAFSLVTFIVLLIFQPALSIVGLYLFFYSLFEIEKMYFIKHQQYNESALSQVLFRLFGNGAKLVPFMMALNAFGLVLSEIMALILVVGYGFKKSIFHLSFKFSTLKKYAAFPAMQTFTMAINLVILDFPILFWSNIYGKPEIGYFVMGQKLLVMPALVISNSVQNSTVHHLLKSTKPLDHYLKLTGTFLGIGAIGSLIFHFAGVDILVSLLGPNWSEGAEVFTLLSLLFATKFTYSLAQASFVLKGTTKIPFCLRILQLGSLFVIIQPNFGFYQAFKIYIIIDIMVDLILTFWGGLILRPPFVFRKLNTTTDTI